MGVFFTHKGDFKNTEKWLKNLMGKNYYHLLDKYGQIGVNALRRATPIDSGLAADSWGYQIIYEDNLVKLIWTNTDIEGGCSVVVLIDRGHASKSGSWVPGKHFIDSAINPVIKQLDDAVRKEATRV